MQIVNSRDINDHLVHALTADHTVASPAQADRCFSILQVRTPPQGPHSQETGGNLHVSDLTHLNGTLTRRLPLKRMPTSTWNRTLLGNLSGCKAAQGAELLPGKC